MVRTRSWSRLSPRTRQLVLAAAVSLLFMSLLSVGWMFWGGSATIAPQPPESKTRAPSKRPIVTLPESAFRLPGMKQDKPRLDAARESWSMNYPDITQVRVANSGEFLVVLTAGSSQSKPISKTSPSVGRVQVWSLDGKKRLDEPVTGRATSMAISFDSSRLAVGVAGGAGVRLWNTQSWKSEPPAISPEGGDVDAVAFSDDGRWLAFTTSSASKDGAWVLWDLDARKQSRRSTTEDVGRTRAIGFAPSDELQIVTGSDDGKLRQWTARSTSQPPHSFGIGLSVGPLAIAPERNLIAVGSQRYFALWDYSLDKRIHVSASKTGDVACVAFSPTGRLICWSEGPSLRCVDTESKRTVATFEGFKGNVLSLAFTPDETRLFTASTDGKLMLWWANQRSGRVE